MRLLRPALVILPALSLAAAPLRAQEGLLGGTLASDKLKLTAEVKVNGRSSSDVSFVFTPAAVGRPIEMRTVSPHGGFEIQNLALTLEARFTPGITAKAVVHVLDLYNRNPSSSDDRIFLREAWGRFGTKYEALQVPPGSSLYLQIGKAPRFSKQIDRHLESYGLWGTAVGRFEEVGAELGGSLGKNVYLRASVASANPLFFRDTNALAGDNGSPERASFDTADKSPYNSGFPILYDAKALDSPFQGSYQYGGGLGTRFRFGSEGRDGVDVLAWVFRRSLADHVTLRGTIYSGDLDLLHGFPGGVSLPVSGNEKIEYGANLVFRLGGLNLFGQVIRQEIAGLVRKGYEAEAAFRIPLYGLFASGDQSVINWIQPVVRLSQITNDFDAPAGFVAPSMAWDWFKLDGGLRIGIVRGVDLTAEYARHDMILKTRVLHPDEFLATFRAAF